MSLVDNIYNEVYGIDSEEIYNDNKPKKMSSIEKKEDKVLDCIYEKTYTCPVCDKEFKNKTMRTGKFKMVSCDMDLKPYFEPIPADYYEIVLCEHCGYAALSKQFTTLRDFQIDLLAEKIMPNFKNIEYSDIYSAEDALFRYKQALKCSIVKKSKASEKAYLALRIAWIYRDLKDDIYEMQYIKIAYDGFMTAIEQEYYPMSGLDETTVMYILANLVYRLGRRDMAKKLLGNIIARRNASPRMQQKIYDFRELLKDD